MAGRTFQDNFTQDWQYRAAPHGNVVQTARVAVDGRGASG